MRISDWSSDVCSSDLLRPSPGQKKTPPLAPPGGALAQRRQLLLVRLALQRQAALLARGAAEEVAVALGEVRGRDEAAGQRHVDHRHVGLQQQQRSEEHTSELQSLIRTSYAVFCLKNKR